jgi:hypothetical protein
MSKTSTHNFYPGPQTRLPKFNWLFFFLSLLTFLFFLLTVYAVVKSNPGLGSTQSKEFFSLELLDTKTACTIFVSLVGLLLLRHQFVIGYRPKLIYEGSKKDAANHPELPENNLVWQVKIKNVGLGTAIFSDFKFRLSLNQTEDKSYDLGFFDTVEKLEEEGFRFEEDYYLANITNGYAMTTKEEKIVFEVILPKGHGIKQLDLKMTFEGYLGGKYRKEVYIIPRRGIFKQKSKELGSDASE